MVVQNRQSPLLRHLQKLNSWKWATKHIFLTILKSLFILSIYF